MAPPKILLLDALFVELSTAILGARAQHAAFEQRLKTLAGRDLASLKWEAAETNTMESEARNFAGHVVTIAEQALGQPDAPLKLSSDRYLEALDEGESQLREVWRRDGMSWEEFQEKLTAHWATFRPLAMWEAIERDHPPQAVVEAAAARAARLLHSVFCSLPMQARGATVELQAQVWAQPRRGRFEIRGGASHWRQVWRAFVTFAAQALPAGVAQQLRDGEQAFEAIERGGFASRERFIMGAGVVLHTYKSIFKLQVPREFAAQLNAFIASHVQREAA